MTNYLDRVAARALGQVSEVQPRLQALFEPSAPLTSAAVADEPLEVTQAAEPTAALARATAVRVWHESPSPEPASGVVRQSALAPTRVAPPAPPPTSESEPTVEVPRAPAPLLAATPIDSHPEVETPEPHALVVIDRQTAPPIEHRRGVATRHEPATLVDPGLVDEPSLPVTPPARLVTDEPPPALTARTTIQVTIGRIDVRAVPPPSPTIIRDSPPPRPAGLSLQDYLRQRDNGLR